jgi:hypothetical protein
VIRHFFSVSNFHRLSPASLAGALSVRRTQATCVGDDEWQRAEGGRSERSLGGEETARSNLREAFFQREELRDFPPLPGMPEVGQVEAPVASVLKSGELGLEEG